METITLDLFEEIRKGSRKAYEQLFKTHYAPLVRFAIEFLKDQDAAEDLVQEVFVKIWERRETIEITLAVKAYLYMAVKNHCLNKLKKEQRNAFLEDTHENTMDWSTNHTEQHADAIGLSQHIQQALEKLPPKCALIFKMSRFEDKTYKEIAESLELSVKTVEAQMGKALHLMRTHLAPYLTIFLLVLSIKFFIA